MKTKIRILHIDDSILDRQLVKDALLKENDGFEVIEADSREKFEKHLAQGNFDLVLSDFNILGFDGLQVLEVVKHKDTNLPVIIVTGTGSEEVAIQAMKMGAADYVIKSVKHIQALAPTIKSVLEHKRTQDERRRVQAALIESEENFRNLFENSPVGKSMTRLDGSVHVSQSFCDMVGYSKEEMKTKKWMDITHPDDIQETVNYMQLLKEGKISHARYEKRFIHKNGNIVWVDLSSYLQCDKDGNPHFFITTMTDITIRKHAEEEIKYRKAYLESIMESSLDMIFTIKSDGTFGYSNKRLFEILGYKFEDINNRSFFEFIPSHLHSFMKERWQEIQHGISGVYETQVIKADGSIIDCQVSHAPLEGKNEYLAILKNITEHKLAEETLLRERALLRTLIDNLPSSIFIKDKNYRKIIANKVHLASMAGHLRNLGLDPTTDIIGKTDFEVSPKELAEQYFKDDEKVIRYGQPIINKEEEGISPDGKQIWLLVSKIPLYDKNGSINGMIGITTDITDFKKAEEDIRHERVLLRTLINNLPDAIYVKDAKGCKLVANTADLQIMNCDSEAEVIGKNDKDIFKNEDGKRGYDEDLKVLKLGQPILKNENCFVDTKGEKHWRQISKIPLFNEQNKITGLVGFGHDITDNKSYEEQLIIAKEKAEESDRLKTAFLHNISHEIRTPMNAIVGFSSFLSDPDLLPEKRKHFTEVIIKSSNQLLSIITDIVNIATIEAGQEKIYEIQTNINSIFSVLYEQFTLKAQKQNVLLSYKTSLPDDNAYITTDGTKLAEVLANLVGNAIKFTKDGNVIFGYEIVVETEHTLPLLQFYVKDTGIGIPVEMHEEIFKRFRQVESTTNRITGGSGLGLSISKAYIELLGGKIWLKSELDKGSTFYFTIPYKKITNTDVKTGKQITEELNAKQQRTKTLLIAEDEDFNYLLIEEVLSKSNLNIIRAVNGREACDICKEKPNIDLILMDLKMPEMDGYEAAKKIKGFLPDIPIVALTAYTNDIDKNKALACGCSDFISKPFNQKQLITKINELIKNHNI